jgi:hypothetical protein
MSENTPEIRENSEYSHKIPVREINLSRLVESLFDCLSAKQKLVLSSRFGIGSGEPKTKTLESIGKNLNITRERVRQIESDAIRALKYGEKNKNAGELVSLVNEIAGEFGGSISAGKLSGEIFSRYFGKREISLQEIRMLEAIFLLAGLKKLKADRETKESWAVSDFDKKYFNAAISKLEEIFETSKKILNIEDVLKKLDHSDFFEKYPQAKPEHIANFLELSKKFGQNVFGDWGKAKWPLIRPRGVREKATLVLLKRNKPLHFREISRLIEEFKLSDKKVHPQTVHNELIRANRFVLVGRGTYALREWGFEEGTVKDVIVSLLKSAGGYLARENIYDAVLKKRKVKKATIAVNLADKKTFEKKKDGYSLRTTN